MVGGSSGDLGFTSNSSSRSTYSFTPMGKHEDCAGYRRESAARSHRKQQAIAMRQRARKPAEDATIFEIYHLRELFCHSMGCHCKDCSSHSSSRIASPDSQQALGSPARRRSSSPCTPGPTRISSRRSPRSRSSCVADAMTCAGSRRWSLRAAYPVYCCVRKLTAHRAGMAPGLRSQ